MLGAVEVLFTICKDVVPLIIKSTLPPHPPTKGKKVHISYALYQAIAHVIPFNANRPCVLPCHLLAPTSAGRPASGGDGRRLCPCCWSQRECSAGAGPQAASGKGPRGGAEIISRGKCWVFLTSVAIHSSSLGTLSKASLKICSFIHRFLFIMRTY